MLSLPAMFLPIGCHVEKKRRCDYTAEYTAEYKQLRAKQLFLKQIASAIMNSEEARFKNAKEILGYYLKEVEKKLTRPKYEAAKKRRRRMASGETGVPAISEDGDLLRESMTKFQKFFALKPWLFGRAWTYLNFRLSIYFCTLSIHTQTWSRRFYIRSTLCILCILWIIIICILSLKIRSTVSTNSVLIT